MSYYDGLNQDHLVFLGFPSGSKLEKLKWEKLKKSIRSLRRETDRGFYVVKTEEETEKALITLSYFDKEYPRSFSPEARFREIWKDLMKFLPQETGLVVLGEAQIIKEFSLDLLAED